MGHGKERGAPPSCKVEGKVFKTGSKLIIIQVIVKIYMKIHYSIVFIFLIENFINKT